MRNFNPLLPKAALILEPATVNGRKCLQNSLDTSWLLIALLRVFFNPLSLLETSTHTLVICRKILPCGFYVTAHFYKRHGSMSEGASITSSLKGAGNLREAKTAECCSEHLCVNALVSGCCFQERSAHLHRCISRAAAKICSKMFWKL